MAVRSVIQYTTGTPGTGKSYMRCARFLVDDFLPGSTGVHYSNFPVGAVPDTHKFPPTYDGETFTERIGKAVAAKHGGDWETYAERVRMIPAEEMTKWETGESGPWDYFKDVDLAGCHIAIDECHNFVGRKHHNKQRQKWQEWLGEIRHRGATVEFLSQAHMKVAKEVAYESALRRVLETSEHIRDPFFGFPLSDWYNLRAAFITGRYDRKIICTEYREEKEKWTVNYREWFKLTPQYFAFYDSFNTPQKGGKAGKTEEHEFQRFSKPRLIWRIFSRHPFRVLLRVAIVAVILWLWSGGLGFVVNKLVTGVSGAVTGNLTEAVDTDTPAEQPNVVEPDPIPERVIHAAQATETPATDNIEQAPAEPLPEPPAEQTHTPTEAHTPEPLNAELIEAQNEQIAALRAELDQARDRQRNEAAIVLVTPNSATFRGGYSYGPGDTIDYGLYFGEVVQAIDYPRRAVVLESGVVLRMGRPDTDDAGLSTPRSYSTPPPSPGGPVRPATAQPDPAAADD